MWIVRAHLRNTEDEFFGPYPDGTTAWAAADRIGKDPEYTDAEAVALRPEVPVDLDLT